MRQTEEPLLRIKTHNRDNMVCIEITDNGEGIPEDYLERIFEPFYTRKVLGRRAGTGLGMAVVYSTVKDHRGYVDIQSELNHGTEITLFFQQTEAEAAPHDRETSLEDMQGKGERILVVDDIREQREIVESILRKLGYTPISVASGEEGVSWLTEHQADLVILDMIMDPGMDGLETFRRMKEIRPEQKAVITSGFTETSRVLAVQELGAGEFIKKPYSIERLGRVIRTELDRAQGA